MKPETPLEVLTRWSPRTERALRTLPDRARLAIAQMYLCMRGLDEIEDHPELDADTKIRLLTALADAFRLGSGFEELLKEETEILEISQRLGEWRVVASPEIGPRIDDAMANLAHRMAYWVERNWRIDTEEDFNLYIRDVSTTLFLLIDDILGWGTGVQGDRSLTLRAGFALQVINMVSGRKEDLDRGVDFVPSTWTADQLFDAADAGRSDSRAWVEQYQPGPAGDFLATLCEGYY